ncbi:MAG: sulfatase-like hydrolase/transferase [Candidatus Pacebacteria bacterium]|nr:sulfatase-like hydrolase/transferase [Candidatus Paceibacterota bacterium]MBT4004946.1 sulfatase-like hydrolase/transferase [Candidatus Paceibacterota bacterium]MBT4358722.1 sulfatase-like hydrolase/transferase [Candidatus Paceibacterota bacterium]MBT4680689.1 sulfatase-like hydrolase/transferase [Candidatus Paceibacterota bacterium]MBT6899151.1 sulfatase-like hydrolase/transferase [Candidatus Paceibacterota bacterium]
MKIKLIQVVLVVAIISIAFIYFFQNRLTSKQQSCLGCNLVVFDADIFRADALECDKHPELTPNLCVIQNDFIKFNNHYSNTDLTRPGVSSFLTSSYPSSHRVWDDFFFLDKKQPTIINLLKNNGYTTTINGQTDSHQVQLELFEKRIEDVLGNENVFNMLNNEQVFLYFYSGVLHKPYLSDRGDSVPNHPNRPLGSPDNMRGFDEIGDKVIVEKYSYLLEKPAFKEFIKSQDGSINGIYPYMNYLCSDASVEKRLVNVDACWEITETIFDQYIDINNPVHIEFVKYLYQERVRDLDVEIGRLINELKAFNLWDKTVFVIRSDHGEELAEHGEIGHSNNLYQELIRIPLWIYIPGVKAKNINYISETIDEAPTLLKILGIEPHPLMAGRNLLVLNEGKDGDAVISQKKMSSVFSIREGDYKLISIGSNLESSERNSISYELYNLQEDPGEKNNIVEENPEIKKRLLSNYYNKINQQPRFEPSYDLYKKLTNEQKNNIYENGYF